MTDIFSITTILCVSYFVIVFVLWIIIPSDWIIQEYPKEWENEEDKNIERLFKEYNAKNKA